MNKKDIIICRCEDVSLQDIHDLLDQGYTTFEEIKRITRVGMGPCQGQTCSDLVRREIAIYTHQKVEDVLTHTTRPLTTGVKLKDIAEQADEE